jgi:iron complex outermembrane receptor protein
MIIPNRWNKVAFSFWFTVGAAMLSASVAVAVDTPTDSDESSQQGGLTEIVVTAQRREQRLQDVPIAVSAVSAETLAQANVTNVADVAKIIPSLSLQVQSGNIIQPFLRGVGNPAVGVGNEASVAIYIDGVYYPRLPAPLFDLNNIERVEVLKGPQGTLFGRNASGGLIQVVTKDPSLDVQVVHASIGYGNYDTTRASLYASTPISDILAADISLLEVNQGNGWGHNIDTGAAAFLGRDYAARSKWLLKPDTGTQITLTLDFAKNDADDLGMTNRPFDGSGSVHRLPVAPYNILPEGGFYDVSGDEPDRSSNKYYGGSLHIRQDVSFADLVSISAFSQLFGYGQYDADFSPLPYTYLTEPYRVNPFSQELQLVSHSNSTLDWIFGLYYLHLPSQLTGANIGGIGVGGAPDASALYTTKDTTESEAAYGQATYHLPADTDVTLGLRYTRDELHANGRLDFSVPSLGVSVPGTEQYASTTFEKLTWRFAIDHKFDEDIHAYVSQSRGFKAGIYNLLPFSTTPAKSEVIDASEVGVKTVTFNDRLRLNAAVFYDKIKDPQVNIYVVDPATGQLGIELINAGGAEVKGVEFDGAASVLKGLSFNFGATFLHAVYTNFQNAPFYFQGTYPATGGPPDPHPGNATGNHLPNAPDFAGNIGLLYSMPMTRGKWDFSVNDYEKGAFFFQPDNYLKQHAYNLLDAQVKLTLPNDRWAIRVWGQNLMGTEYYVGADESGGYSGNYGAPGAPRTFGVSFDYTYN